MNKKLMMLALLAVLLFAPTLAEAGNLYDDGEIVISDGYLYPKTDSATSLGKSSNQFSAIYVEAINNSNSDLALQANGVDILTVGSLGVCVIGKISLTDDIYLGGGDIINGSTKVSLGANGVCIIGSISNTANLYLGAYLYANGLKSGTDQNDAGAAAGEIYVDTDDQTLKQGT